MESKIPQTLIDECENLAILEDNIKFIFINEDGYYIGGIEEFDIFPSRFFLYDTETKMFDKYARYEYVVDFFKKIGFIPSRNNLGYEYEQVFYIETDDDYYIIRLKPNLFLKIEHTNIMYDPVLLYYGFFIKNIILNGLLYINPSFKSAIRDIKIDSLIN